jgi:hypothetical protein
VESSHAILEFGSRSGSFFALGLFGAMFVVLGWGVAREIRRRSPPTLRWRGSLAGWLLFLLPVILVYCTSLNGFYEAKIGKNELQLLYLMPGWMDVVPLAEISAVEAQYAFRFRWRLHITTVTGGRFESATWHRVEVQEAARRLQSLLKR